TISKRYWSSDVCSSDLKQGKVIDVNNGLHVDGPFSLERAGTIPSEDLIELCFSGKFDQQSLIRDITYNGGLNGYLKTDNIREIEIGRASCREQSAEQRR